MKNSTSITFNIVFHNKHLGEKEDKKLHVFARITINGKRIELSCRQIINPKDLNEKLGMAKPINDEYNKLNNYLEQLRNSFIACYREMYLHKKEITRNSKYNFYRLLSSIE